MNMPLVINMPEFWTNQGSEYTKILHTLWFWICQGSEYVKVTQGSEYAWICLIMSKYAGIGMNMPKYAWIAFLL